MSFVRFFTQAIFLFETQNYIIYFNYVIFCVKIQKKKVEMQLNYLIRQERFSTITLSD